MFGITTDWELVKQDINKIIFERWLTPQSTVTSNDVSPTLREPYIETGYRIVNKPKRYYIQSLFQVHNETINVWSHIVGAFVLLYKIAQTFQIVDVWKDDNALPVLLFSMGAMECICLSAFAHLMHSRSEFHHFKYFQMDYVGIGANAQATCVLYFFLVGSEDFYSLPGIHLMLPIHVIICFGGFVAMSYAKIYCQPEDALRIVLNIGQASVSAFYCGLPIWYKLYEIFLAGDVDSLWNDFLPLFFHYVLLTTAGLFYGLRIPEVFAPGTFDIVGQGHQLFHILLTCVSVCQFNTLMDIYPKRASHLVRLASPSIWNTFVLHAVLMVSCTAFIVLSTQSTKVRAREEYSKFKAMKEQ